MDQDEAKLCAARECACYDLSELALAFQRVGQAGSRLAAATECARLDHAEAAAKTALPEE